LAAFVAGVAAARYAVHLKLLSSQESTLCRNLDCANYVCLVRIGLLPPQAILSWACLCTLNFKQLSVSLSAKFFPKTHQKACTKFYRTFLTEHNPF